MFDLTANKFVYYTLIAELLSTLQAVDTSQTLVRVHWAKFYFGQQQKRRFAQNQLELWVSLSNLNRVNQKRAIVFASALLRLTLRIFKLILNFETYPQFILNKILSISLFISIQLNVFLVKLDWFYCRIDGLGLEKFLLSRFWSNTSIVFY